MPDLQDKMPGCGRCNIPQKTNEYNGQKHKAYKGNKDNAVPVQKPAIFSGKNSQSLGIRKNPYSGKKDENTQIDTGINCKASFAHFLQGLVKAPSVKWQPKVFFYEIICFHDEYPMICISTCTNSSEAQVLFTKRI